MSFYSSLSKQEPILTCLLSFCLIIKLCHYYYVSITLNYGILQNCIIVDYFVLLYHYYLFSIVFIILVLFFIFNLLLDLLSLFQILFISCCNCCFILSRVCVIVFIIIFYYLFR